MSKEFKLKILINEDLEGKIIVNKIDRKNETYLFVKDKKEYELPIWLIAIFRKIGTIPFDLSDGQLYDLIKQLDLRNFEEDINNLENSVKEEVTKINSIKTEMSNKETEGKIVKAFEELKTDPWGFLRLNFFNLFVTDNAKAVYQKILEEKRREWKKKLNDILQRTMTYIKVGYTFEDLEKKISSKNLDYLTEKKYLIFIDKNKTPIITTFAFEEVAKESPIVKEMGFEIRKVNINEIKEKLHFTYKIQLLGNELLSFWEVIKSGEYVFIVDWISKTIIIPTMPPATKKDEVFLSDIPHLIEYPEGIRNILEVPENLNLYYERVFDKLLNLAKKSVYFKEVQDYYLYVASIILTWIPEITDVIPFIRFLQQHGSGKSIALRFVHKFAFRSVYGSNITKASLARLAHYHGVTLLLDELHLYSKDSETDEILTLLRSRNMREAKYIKAVPGDESNFISMEVFGLTYLAGRVPMPEDIESRCIRLSLYPAPKNWKSEINKISESEQTEIIKDLCRLRILVASNLELIQKLREKVIQIRDYLISLGYDHRFSELIAPLILLIPYKYRNELKERLKSLVFERRSETTSPLDEEIVGMLIELYNNKEVAEDYPEGLLKFSKKGNVKKIPFSFLVDSFVSKIKTTKEFGEETITSIHVLASEKKKWETEIGKTLKRLGIQTARLGHENVRYIIISDEELKLLEERFLREPEIGELNIDELPKFDFDDTDMRPEKEIIEEINKLIEEQKSENVISVQENRTTEMIQEKNVIENKESFVNKNEEVTKTQDSKNIKSELIEKILEYAKAELNYSWVIENVLSEYSPELVNNVFVELMNSGEIEFDERGNLKLGSKEYKK